MCLRQIILNQFEETNVPNQGTHKCCMVCHQLCKCSGEACTVPQLPFESTKQISVPIRRQQNKRTVTFQKKELLKELLTVESQITKKEWLVSAHHIIYHQNHLLVLQILLFPQL